MTMAASDALVCPACGARNKPKWEFCVRCGESLQGAETAAPLAKTVVKGKGKGKSKLTIQIHEREAESSFPPGLIVGAGAVLLVGLAVAGWRYASTYKGAPPADPSLFTVADAPRGPSVGRARDRARGRGLRRGSEAPRAGSGRRSPGPAGEGGGRRLLEPAVPMGLRRSAGRHRSCRQRAGAIRRSRPADAWRVPRALCACPRSRRSRPPTRLRSTRTWSARSPTNLAVQEDLGRLYYRSGDFAKAAPFLEKAVGARSGDPVLRQELAYSVEKSGDKARAAQLYREVLGLAPGADVSRSHLAAARVRAGQERRGGGHPEGRRRARPEPSRVCAATSETCSSEWARPQDAIREYKEYARLAPNAPDAKELAERAARLEGPGKS